MAIVDADYKFIFADVGCQGRISDSGVFKNTAFWKALVQGSLNIPLSKPLPLPMEPTFADEIGSAAVPYFIFLRSGILAKRAL